MYVFNVHAIAPFVSHALSVLLCAFLILKNPRSGLHITLGLFCLAASLWQLSTGMMFIAQTDELAIFWDRIVYVGVNLQWLMHFHFTTLLLKTQQQRRWLIAAYALAAFFAVFTPTDYLVHGLYRYAWGCHSIAGPLHHSFVLVSTGFYVKCLYMIFRRFQRSTSQVERTRYKYYMVGFAIFVSASLAYLPAYKISVYPFAYWFESAYCVILVYIIARYRMLDIETVIHKTLLWLAVSVAMFVPVTIAIYFAYPALKHLNVYSFIGSVAALVAGSVAWYSVVQPRIDHAFQRAKYNYGTVVERFMESVVTLNDKDRLADITRETLRSSTYAENVRCFWAVDDRMQESGTLSGEPMSLHLDPAVRAHLAAKGEIVERDLLAEDPAYRVIKERLDEMFTKTGSHLLLPIVYDQGIAGLVTLDRKANLRPYTDLDRKFLREVSVGVSVAVINSLMFETQKKLFDREREARKAQEELVKIKDEMNRDLEHKVAERTEALSVAMSELHVTNEALVATKDALWGEMQLAAKIQTVLLPKLPHMRGYEICACTRPASEVGGDYHDVINTDRGDWLVIGDVSGHGVSAGLIMMMVQTALHASLTQNSELTPGRLLSVVNDCIWKNLGQMDEQQFVTMTVLSSDHDGRFTFAGLHQDILISRARSQAVEAIETQGVWVGMTSPIDELVEERSLRLEIGDVMLLYTDGITEAVRRGTPPERFAAESDQFGPTRLAATFADSWRKSPEDARDALLEALRDYECADDVTFVIVKRLE